MRSHYVPGDEITVFCNSEYQIINSSKPFVMRVCLSDRTWSGIDPQCEKSNFIIIIIKQFVVCNKYIAHAYVRISVNTYHKNSLLSNSFGAELIIINVVRLAFCSSSRHIKM